MSESIRKSPGDRGGHVLGMTASGRPIYGDAHAHAPMYHRFEPRDHAAALSAHQKAAEAPGVSREKAALHRDIAHSHRKAWEHLTSPAGRITSWAQQWESLARSRPESPPCPESPVSARGVLSAYLGSIGRRG